MAIKIQLRGDTEVNWKSVNPILAEREIALDTTKEPYKIKIGDGTNHWEDLPYLSLNDISGGNSIIYGASNNDTYIPNDGDAQWVLEDVKGDTLVQYPIYNGSRYVYIAIPNSINLYVQKVEVDGAEIPFDKNGIWNYKNTGYTLYKSLNSYDMTNGMEISIFYALPKIPDMKINISDGDILTTTPVNTIDFQNCLFEDIDGTINSKRIIPYTKVIDLEQTKTDEGGSQNIYEDNINKLSFTPPLRIRKGDTDLSSIVDIDDTKFEEQHVPAYLAYSIGKKRIKQAEILAFENIAYKTNYPHITYDQATKIYTLEEDVKYGNSDGTDYFVGFRVASQSYCLQAGTIKIAIVDADNIDNTIIDFTGNPLEQSRDYKLGYWVGDFEVGGVLKVKGSLKFKLKILNQCDDILIQDRTNGASGVFIQVLTSKEQTSRALNTWSLDTGKVFSIGRFEVGKNFVNTDMSIVADVGKAVNNNSVDFDSDLFLPLNTGEFIYCTNQSTVTNTDDLLNIQKTSFFNAGYFLDAERTKLLRNQRVRIWSNLRIHYDPSPDAINSDKKHAWFIVAKWAGAEDEFTGKVVSGIQSDGSLTYLQGFTELYKLEVSMNNIVQETEKDFFMNPNNYIDIPADINNLAIVIVPKHQIANNIDIKNIRIEMDDPKTEYLVESKRLDGAEGFFTHAITDTVVSDANIIPITKTPLDLYKNLPDDVSTHSVINNTAPITVISNEDNTNMQGLQFEESGQIFLNMSFNAVTEDLGNVPKRLTFYVEMEDSSGQSTRTIPHSIRHFTIYRHDYPTYCDLSFPLNVIKGDKIRFMFLCKADNDVWLKYDIGAGDTEGMLFQINATYLNTGKFYRGNFNKF